MGETSVKLPFDCGQPSRFLTLLDGEGGTFCFQTLDDNKQRNDRNGLARTRHGRLDDLAPLLEKLNRFGAGIFVTVNEVRNGAPRTADNVTNVRAVVVDLDGAP